MKSICVPLLALFALPGAARAQAEFTLNVPVEVQALMPEINTYQVLCYLHVGPTQTDPNGDGVGHTYFDVDADGNFSGVVTVEVDTEDGVSPNSITRYTCQLNFDGARPGYLQTSDERWLTKPGTEAVTLVEGSIP